MNDKNANYSEKRQISYLFKIKISLGIFASILFPSFVAIE